MKAFRKSLLGLAIGLFLSLMLAFLAGENPLRVLKILIASSFGSADDFALTLFYSTSLILTGLSVALSFRAGLFNIGAEGQLYIGSLGSTVLAIELMQSGIVHQPVLAFLAATIFAFSFGALWGSVPAFLKAYRGSHEVIVTMMMNFVAAGIVSYAIVGPYKNSNSQSPESLLVPSAMHFPVWDPIHKLLPNSPINLTFLLAVLLCFVFWFIFERTRTGFEWRAFGLNPSAADLNGISKTKYILLSMSLSGGVAGLVALNEIFGSAGKLRLGFSADYGFIGIAVALLARNHPLAIIPSALLFGALQKGASDLDLETERINRDFAKVIQAVIVLSVIAASSLSARRIQEIKIHLKNRLKRKVRT